ncbi:bifunctional oligoribonuclease/PAP phosphatase NrnA [bacterium]|nr:bifunctional oligoribonuclease/PAP phosphatase NrnA [bacterium]
MAENQIQTQVIQLIRKSQRILILPSSPPDGDSIGSALALYLILRKLGKEATVVCTDAIPEVYRFLPITNVIDNNLVTSNDFIVTLDCSKSKIDTIKTDLEDNKVNIIITPKQGSIGEKEVSFHYGATKYDLIIVVDAGDLSQLGKLYEENAGLFTQIPVINIDHHVSNNHFGKVNFIDIMASSTTELLISIIEEYGRIEGKDLINEDVATLLLAGIITDTGSFQNANTSPKAFASASHLLGYGARQQEIIQHIYKTKNLTMLKLWGRVLTKIQFDSLYRIVWSTISKEDFQQTKSNADETGDIIDELMTNAPGADVVLLIKEKEDGIVSCSVRTTSQSVDASAIAEMFDGGGHVQAAGFKVQSSDLKSTEYKIIENIRKFQARRLHIHPDEKPEVLQGKQVVNMEQKAESVWEKDEKEVKENSSNSLDLKVKPNKEVKNVKKNLSKKKFNKQPDKVKPDKVVENISKNEDEVDLEPGVTYKFEQ